MTLFVLKELVQFLSFFLRCGFVGINKVVEQMIYIATVRCHATLQYIVCIGLISQQLGNLATQVDESLTYLEVVLAIIVCTLGITSHIHLFTKLTLCRVGHKGRVAGHVEGEYPSLFTLFLCSECCCFSCCLWQTIQLCFIGDVQLESLILFQQVL